MSESPTGAAALPRDLLDILVCPLGKAPLRVEGDLLVCTRCGAGYRVEDGVPNMLVDDAVLPDGVSSTAELECSRATDAGDSERESAAETPGA